MGFLPFLLCWWQVSFQMVDESSFETGDFFNASGKQNGFVSGSDERLVFIEDWKESLLLSPVARLSQQMEGRVDVARLMLSSGLRCDLTGLRGWFCEARVIPSGQSCRDPNSRSAQAAAIPQSRLKPHCFSASVTPCQLMHSLGTTFYLPLLRILP